MTSIIPKVTVLMPVYNGEKYLQESMNSILKQSFTDFEFLIINDGSRDKSTQLIDSFRDYRIKLVDNRKNLGLINTLNKGLDLSRGEYIVRMDCDDISFPDRLKKQVDFMERNKDVGVSGTWFISFEGPQTIVARYPDDQDSIRCGLLFNSVLAHPTVIIRKKVFHENKLYYDPSFQHAEDYELWNRAINVVKISNIREVLLRYRIHPEQITNFFNEKQVQKAGRIRLDKIRQLGISPTQDEFEVHQALSVCQAQNIENHFYERVGSWLCKLKMANDEQMIFPEPAFSKTLLKIFIAILNKGPLPTWRWIPILMRSKFLTALGFNNKFLIDYIIRESYYRLLSLTTIRKWKRIK